MTSDSSASFAHWLGVTGVGLLLLLLAGVGLDFLTQGKLLPAALVGVVALPGAAVLTTYVLNALKRDRGGEPR